MRILAFILTGLVVLLAAALIGPSFVDWNQYKERIAQQVKSASGYDVRIDGDLSLAVVPSPRVTIHQVTIASPHPVKERTLASVEEAQVRVALLPLLQKRVVVESIRLVRPDIRLEVSEQGGASWMAVKAAETVEAVGEAGAAAIDAPQSGDTMKSIALDSVVIEDGRFLFANYQTGATQLVEKLNADLSAGSLSGPFKGKGDLVYGGNKITFDGQTGAIEAGSNDIQVNATLGLPDKKASLTFNGVAGRIAPYNAQGEITLNADKLESLAAAAPAPLHGRATLSGMLTASEEKAGIRDATFTAGKLKGAGLIDVGGLKERNPLSVTGRFKLDGGINVNDWMVKSAAAPAPAQGQEGGDDAPAKSPVPQTLTLPLAVNLDIALDAPELSMDGQTLKGVNLSLAKQGGMIAVALKADDIPGRGNIDAKGTLRYAASATDATGGVTYSDPSLSFTAKGRADQLPTLLRALAPAQKDNAALEAFKTAEFDVSGGLDGLAVTLKDSRLKLENTTLALGGSYAPPAAKGGKPNVSVDLSADYLNIDDIQTRLGGGKKQAVQPAANQPKDLKAALEPVRNFSLPVNLTFDVSLQKARINGMDASGIRLKGKSIGDTLRIETASAQNLMGAAVSVKGEVGSLKNLSGIDLDLYGKTADVKALMRGLKMDASKLPAQLSAAEATVDAKGTVDALAFNANVKALSGQLDAAGTATSLLTKPVFGNLTVRAKHPNFVQAMQIVNPAFTGGPGMAQPLDLYAKLVNQGKIYQFEDFRASLGNTTASGDLRIDNSAAKPALKGTLVLGDLPLDTLLGAKQAKGQGGGAAASTGGERWSSNAFDMGWMHSANMDLAVSAKSITYGGWDFREPKTAVTLNNGSLKVQDLTGGLFNGTVRLNAAVQSSQDQRQPVSLSVDAAMNEVNMERLAGALSSSNRIKASGTGSLTFDVAGTGISPNAMVNSLRGKAKLNATNVIFHGFDLAQLTAALLDSGKPLDRLQNIVGGAVSTGKTQFDTITGDYTIAEGVVRINKMEMTGPAAQIASTGNVSLPRWTIDTEHTITLANAKEVDPFKIVIRGPLDNPTNTFGKGLFDEMLRRRVGDKIQEKLPDLLGDKATDKLQQLGILPQKQAPAPAAPTPDAAGEAAPQAAPQPQQQQQTQPTPEDMLRDAIGGFLSR